MVVLNAFHWLALALEILACQQTLGHNFPDLVSATQCDKFSLDALAHQFYIPRIDKVFTDLSTFVNEAIDATVDSVQHLMNTLPGKSTSDRQDVQVRASFDSLKRGMNKIVRTARRNLSLSWEDVLQVNLAYLNRSEEKPGVYLDAVSRLSDTYENACSATTKQLAVALVEPLKQLLKSSVQSLDQMKQGIKILAELMPNFLGKLTGLAVDRKVNLDLPVKVPDRLAITVNSSAADPVQSLVRERFLVKVFEADLRVLLSERRSNSPEKLELTRRDLTMHWGQKAHEELVENKQQEQDKPEKVTTKEPGLSTSVVLENRVLSLIQLYT